MRETNGLARGFFWAGLSWGLSFYASKTCKQSTRMFRPEEHVETIHFLSPRSVLGAWSQSTRIVALSSVGVAEHVFLLGPEPFRFQKRKELTSTRMCLTASSLTIRRWSGLGTLREEGRGGGGKEGRRGKRGSGSYSKEDCKTEAGLVWLCPICQPAHRTPEVWGPQGLGRGMAAPARKVKITEDFDTGKYLFHPENFSANDPFNRMGSRVYRAHSYKLSHLILYTNSRQQGYSSKCVCVCVFCISLSALFPHHHLTQNQKQKSNQGARFLLFKLHKTRDEKEERRGRR